MTQQLTGADREPALVVNHLTKRFGTRTAFSEVSFEINGSSG
jgi:hypothetical protein